MKKSIFTVFAVAMLLLACKKEEKTANPSDTGVAEVYYNGDIITMEGDIPTYAEAVVVKDGKILFVGNEDEAMKHAGAGHSMKDLEGKTLLPGFIDGHGHMYNTGLLGMAANVLPAPDGPGTDFDAIVKAIKDWTATEDGKFLINKMGWIMANGYDDSQLKEKTHPTKEILDRISTTMPVVVIHQSGHLACVNTKALEIMGYNKDTKAVEGGLIRRDKNGNPNGVLEEAAFFNGLLPVVVKKTDEELQLKCVQKGQESYAKYGYTTAQEGRSTADATGALAIASKKNKIFIDIVSYPDIIWNKAAVTPEFYKADRSYTNHYRIGGVKLTLDGSPQGKTAWLTKCYHVNPDGQTGCYKGYPIMPDEKVIEYVTTAFKNKWQIMAHTNGDAAIDQFIKAVGAAIKTDGYKDHRSVMIHGQTLRKDQIPMLAKLKILPSLFPMHTFYWGDWHRESVLGPERAAYISPSRDVVDAGMTITSHHDAPVTFPNSLRVLDATVNRVTRSGFILGPNQRLTPYEGLKTLTEWAAIQHFEENNKGTIAVGKLADLVILDRNPLKGDPMTIHEIEVYETIKEGKSVYKTTTTSKQKLIGGWDEIPVDKMVTEAANFAVGKINAAAKLKRVVQAKRQIVKGLNFDLTFELENGSLWQALVYRDLQGNYSLNQPPQKKQKTLAGGWNETEIDQISIDAVNFMLSRMNTNAKLDKILTVKKQIVKGINFDLTFRLDNNSIWRGTVYRDLDGNFSIGKNATKI